MSNTNNTLNQQNKKNWKKIGIIAGAFLFLAGGFYMFSSDAESEKANVNVTATQQSSGKPIESQDPNYIENIQQRNEADAEQALESNKSHIDVATNKISEDVNENEFLNNTNQNGGQALTASDPITQPTIEQVVEERVIIKEVAVPSVAEYNPLEDVSLLQMLSNDKPKTFVLTQVSNVEKREELRKQKDEEEKARMQSAKEETEKQNVANETVTVNQVGELIPATLQTPINSTRSSIIRTIIESGPLSGAILTGSFQQNGTAVSITFNKLSHPMFKNSLDINALAIDYKNASTALASSVNRHIPEKILMAFAGSFAQGYADGLKNNNVETTQRTTDDGKGNQSTIETNKTRPKTTGEINREAAANAINKTSELIGGLIPQQPTVKVHGNSEIGIYFTSDFVINKNMFKDPRDIEKFIK